MFNTLLEKRTVEHTERAAFLLEKPAGKPWAGKVWSRGTLLSVHSNSTVNSHGSGSQDHDGAFHTSQPTNLRDAKVAE